MKKFYSVVITFAVLLILVGGCTSQKKLSYFNTVNEAAADSINQKSNFWYEATIKPGDMLIITVSGTDPKSIAAFNLPVVAYLAPGSDQFYGNQTLQPYTVDVDGTIAFPLLGKLKIAGFTRAETIKMLTQR